MLQQLLTRIPNWALNTAFFVILILFVFLALSPTMVFGKIDCKLFDDRRCPRLSINVNVGGRDVRTLVADGTGTFFIPVVSKLTGVTADLYYAEGTSVDIPFGEQIEFDLPSIWGEREFRVKVRAKSASEFEEYELKRRGGNWLFVAIDMIAGIGQSNAQELKSFDSELSTDDFVVAGRSRGSKITAERGARIDAVVIEAIVRATGQSATEAAHYDLRKLSIDEIEMFNSVVAIELKSTIQPEHWGFVTSAKDAANYLKSVEELGIEGMATKPWSKIQREQGLKGNKLIFSASPDKLSVGER